MNPTNHESGFPSDEDSKEKLIGVEPLSKASILDIFTGMNPEELSQLLEKIPTIIRDHYTQSPVPNSDTEEQVTDTLPSLFFPEDLERFGALFEGEQKPLEFNIKPLNLLDLKIKNSDRTSPSDNEDGNF